MELLFMSNLFPKETKEDVQSKMRFNMYDAADVLQWNLVNGFADNDVMVSMINLLPVDSWPRNYRDAFIKRGNFGSNPNARGIDVGYCNVKYIKRLHMKSAYVAETKKWERTSRENKARVVVAYSLNESFMAAIAAIKKKDPSIKAVAVVADLPEFSAPTGNLLRKGYRRYINWKTKKDLAVFDGFVLLTEQMARRMGIQVPYMVMEGISEERSLSTTLRSPPKTVFYSGSLNAKYGIIALLEAFSKIEDSDMQLILCGLGDAEDVVREYAKNDPRIRFLGKISHEQVLVLQQNATVLVNPRQNNEEFTKYSFPSKTMEYLASGVPVVAYKLDGIPDEYDAYLNYVEDNSSESLAAKLVEICGLDERIRDEMGKRGAEFVLKSKNACAQCRRILEFLNRYL